MFKIVAAATAAVLLAQGASAATVVNGSFEQSPGVAGYQNGASFGSLNWDFFSSLPGWTAGPGGVEIQTASTLGLTPADGSYYVELDTDGNSSIWQDIYFAAGKYVLSFMYSPRTAQADSNGIDYGVDGVASGSITGPSNSTAVGSWSEVTLAFTILNGGTYRLNFAASGNGDGVGGLIDNVQISTVPVPAAGLLLLGGLGGLAGLRRRKTA